MSDNYEVLPLGIWDTVGPYNTWDVMDVLVLCFLDNLAVRLMVFILTRHHLKQDFHMYLTLVV